MTLLLLLQKENYMKMLCDLMTPMVLVGIATFAGNWTIQDDEDVIVIVDEDGREMKEKIIKMQRADGGDGAGIMAQDGKIVIVDRDGTKREINVDGAQSIVVNSSVESVTENGETKRVVGGKAIIIGPDGERQEIDLGEGVDVDLGQGFAKFKVFGDGLAPGMFQFREGPVFEGGDGLPRSFSFANNAAGKYMIGVNCKKVSDELRAHLDLADGVGLVVLAAPGEETPAAGAGILQHDILVYADQEELAEVNDLVEAVQAAGKEDRELSLTMIRKGKELGVELKPIERKSVVTKW
ncbi:MAG: PDZ domain-containing protein, partial [Planctomycetota bacterium]